MTRSVGLVLSLLLAFAASPVAAQEQRAAMLQTGATDEGAESVRGAFDRIARSRFERLAPMPLDAAPPLSLDDLQLAVGCVGESADCLRAVAERVGVRVMVVPSVERSSGSFVASFLLLDADTGDLRRVTRRAESESELFDRVDPMLRELFELPPPPLDEAAGDVADRDLDAASPERAPEAATAGAAPGFPVGPVIVGGVGLLAIAGGALVGALAKSAEGSYAAADTTTREGVDAAQASLSEAETGAAVANVLFAVGGAAVLGALVWWLVGADSPFGVSASPEGVAFSYEMRWGGDS